MQLDDLLIHPNALSLLQSLLANPPHSLLLSGPVGVGKYTVATSWATALGTTSTLRSIGPDDKGTLAIETIRQLYRDTRSKHTDSQVIIIRDADAMTTEAQNAFLKLLEEPPSGVVFVLTSSIPENLLPTIRSRIQHIVLHALAGSTVQDYIRSLRPGIDEHDVAQIAFAAQGRPGLASTMVRQPEALEAQRQRMQRAKTLLTSPPYNRYALIGSLSADRQECQQTLESMLIIAQAQLQQTAEPHWLTIADQLQQTLQNITQNGNIKAQLLRLFSVYS